MTDQKLEKKAATLVLTYEQIKSLLDASGRLQCPDKALLSAMAMLRQEKRRIDRGE